jgi:phosphatidylinositol-3-phosphatase
MLLGFGIAPALAVLALFSHSPAPASSAGPCGSLAGTAPKISHVLVIVEENTSYSSALGLPYIHALSGSCGLATNYHGVTHPSLGNYLALTSGSIPGGVRGTDCSPSSWCRSTGRSIFGQTNGNWRVWAESMPHPCSHLTTGLYAVRHTAAPYYSRLGPTCRLHQVGLMAPRHGLGRSLSTGRLPRFGLIVPNVVNDMHNGCLSCGDRWLRTWVSRIVASPAYRNGSTVLFITWDEAYGTGNHLPLIAVSPYTRPGSRTNRPYAHYALLRSMEDILHLSHLGNAAHANRGLAPAFGLG